MKKFLWYQGPLVGWAITIFLLSSMPKLARVSLFPHVDKLAHAVFYGVLTWTAHRAFFHQHRFVTLRRWSLSLAIVFAIVYGLSDEFHQSFVPGREPSLLDLGADLAGALAAAWIISFRQRQSKPQPAAD